jgi:hypothetical protein
MIWYQIKFSRYVTLFCTLSVGVLLFLTPESPTDPSLSTRVSPWRSLKASQVPREVFVHSHQKPPLQGSVHLSS